MSVTVLKPRVVKPEPVSTPQCCVKVKPPTHAPMWRRNRYESLRPSFDASLCQRESVVEIDGKHYCRIHAGQRALEKWVNGELQEVKA